MSGETPLAGWIARALARTEPKTAGIVVEHVTAGQRIDVQTFGAAELTDAKVLANVIERACDDYVKGIAPSESGSGFEQFLVSAFADGSATPFARFPIARKTGGALPIAQDGVGLVASEAPTVMGQLGQSMRQGEAWHGFNLEMARHSFGAIGTVMKLIADRLAASEREAREYRDEIRDIIFREATQTAAREEAQRVHDRNMTLYKGLMDHAPTLLALLTGKEVPGGAGETVVKELGAAVAKMSAKDTETLLGLVLPKLSEPGQIALMAILNQAQADADAKKPAS